jgi:isopentenyl diphosphate isomerase/L-lactate dehydrogenase-like FMN-dependent dehydrogenase
MEPPKDYGGMGRAIQGQIYTQGAVGIKPKVPTDPLALAFAASNKMTPEAYWYVAGSAGMQRTAEANVTAFERYQIVPRMLRDVRERSTASNVLGTHLAAPVLFAPIGVLEMAHSQAEVAVAKAAATLGVPMVISTQGSRPMEETSASLGPAPMWYQLYWSGNNDLMRSLVTRAEKAGAKAIVVTLDTHAIGWRTRDLDLGFLPFAKGMGLAQYFSDPVFLELVKQRVENPPPKDPSLPTPRPTLAALGTLWSQAAHYPGNTVSNLLSGYPRAAVETFLDVFPCSGLKWTDLELLKSITKLPIILKGIQTASDAELALRHGVDGIVVSNHGGRQVDGAIASVDALEAVARELEGRIPIIFDSGIRSGADVFKALALGASAVFVGRPWLYGLALDGADGAKAVMERIIAELDITMALAGVKNLSEINRDCIRRAGAASGAKL